MEKESIKKNFVLSTLFQLLKVVCPLITAPYVARVLGAKGVGIYSYTWAYQAYFTMFASLGTINYGAREIARIRDNQDQCSKVFWEIELLTVITTLVSLGAWGVWVCYNIQYRIYYIILSINILAVIFDISWYYAGIEKFKYTVTQNSIFKLLGICLILILVKKESDLYIYIAIMSGMVLGSNMSMWMYLPRHVKIVSAQRLEIFRHLSGTLVFFIPTIATSIYTLLDKTLIGIITKDNFENGYYEQAVRVVGLAQSVSFLGLNSVLGPRISYLFSQKKYKEIHKRISLSLDLIMFVGWGGAFGLLGISSHFVPFFFGAGYEKTKPILQLICFLLLVQGISNCLGAQYYNPIGLRALSAKLIIVGSIVNLILNLVLIPKLYSLGAAISSLLAETIICILYVYFAKRFIKMNLYIEKGCKKILSAAIMFMIIYVIGEIISTNYLALVLQITIGASAYILSLYILKDRIIYTFFIPQAESLLRTFIK